MILKMTNLAKRIFYKELVSYRKRSSTYLSPIVFFLITIALYPLALSNDPADLSFLAPGITWICVLLSTLLSIQNIFKRKENESAVDSKKSEQELAYASLLIEVINSDNKFDDRERDKLLEILSSKLDIHKEELDNFTELAQKQSEDSTSLYEFTREINDQYEYEEKVSLITDLWGIAYSDGKLDKYEDYVIRKIADLIYVSHADFIKSKLKVKNTINL